MLFPVHRPKYYHMVDAMKRLVVVVQLGWRYWWFVRKIRSRDDGDYDDDDCPNHHYHHQSLSRYPPNFHKRRQSNFHVDFRSYPLGSPTYPMYYVTNSVAGHGNSVVNQGRRSLSFVTNVSIDWRSDTIS